MASGSELRKTISSSLSIAFGIVIGMVWTMVVLSGFSTAGFSLSTTGGTWYDWGLSILVAMLFTIICVFSMTILEKWSK